MQRAAEAFFFLIIIGAGFAYLLLTTPDKKPPQLQPPAYNTESYKLYIEMERTFRLVYGFPLRPFTRISDYIIRRPGCLFDECLNLIEKLIVLEQQKAYFNMRKQWLEYYLAQFRRHPRQINPRSIDDMLIGFSNWIGKVVNPVDRQQKQMKGLFKIPRIRENQKPQDVIKKLLAENRRKLIGVERESVRITSKVRQNFRSAVLYSFCSLVSSTVLCWGLIAGMVLCRRYLVSDKSHLTAVCADDSASGTIAFKKGKPDPEIIARAKREGFYSTALKEILGILQAYRSTPASVSPYGHGNKSEGLYEHSLKVMDKMLDGASAEMDRRELALCGLAHDCGKILTYKLSGNKWKSTGMYHDVISGAILRSINLKDFPEVAITRMILVVSHHHNPEALPLNVPEKTAAMLELLIKADAQAAREEKTKTIKHTTNAKVKEFRTGETAGPVQSG